MPNLRYYDKTFSVWPVIFHCGLTLRYPFWTFSEHTYRFMLTIFLCKLSLSKTQYIIKTASIPLFYLYKDLNLSVCYLVRVFLIKLFKVAICKMNEQLQWLNMNSSVLNTNPCCFFFLRTSQIMTITSTSSTNPPPPPPAMPAIVPTDSPSAEEQLLDHDLILTAYTLFSFLLFELIRKHIMKFLHTGTKE